MSYYSPCEGQPGKLAWPELVGENGKKAASIIEEENPYVKTIVLPDGSATIRNIDCGRVWVFVDSTGVVVKTPYVG